MILFQHIQWPKRKELFPTALITKCERNVCGASKLQGVCFRSCMYNAAACDRCQVPILTHVRERCPWVACQQRPEHAEPCPHNWEEVPNTAEILGIAQVCLENGSPQLLSISHLNHCLKPEHLVDVSPCLVEGFCSCIKRIDSMVGSALTWNTMTGSVLKLEHQPSVRSLVFPSQLVCFAISTCL